MATKRKAKATAKDVIERIRGRRDNRRRAEKAVKDARQAELIQLLTKLATDLAPLKAESDRLYKECEALKDQMVAAMIEVGLPVQLADGRRIKLVDNFTDKNGKFVNSVWRVKAFSRFNIEIETAAAAAPAVQAKSGATLF